jgi:FAD/FMN-containing dehydrogenase
MSNQNPAGVLFVEFDDGGGQKSKSARKVMKMMDEFGATVEVAETQDDVEDIRSVRHSISAIYSCRSHGQRAVEFSGATVPIDKINVYLESLRKLVSARKIEGYISGRIGAGELGVVTLVNLGRIGDRQAVFGFMRDYCQLAVKLGGTIAGDSGDGRTRIAAARGQYGDEMLGIFERVKEIFDPKGIFNPGVVIGTGEEELIDKLDPEPAPRFADYYPRV